MCEITLRGGNTFSLSLYKEKVFADRSPKMFDCAKTAFIVFFTVQRKE